MAQHREIHLVRRPKGVPTLEDFAMIEVQTPDVGEGEIQIEALLISVDPYMRPRLDADQALNEPLPGGAIGRVTASRNPKFKEGDLVRHGYGFREQILCDGRAVALLTPDPELSLTVYMHALGGTGITAYGGLLQIGQVKDGEEVVVSTAGGAVGSVVAQIAKIKGCRVVGSTGSAEKAAWLKDVAGLDAVINYKAEPFKEALAAATPKGIDVYFENVGGAQLDAVLPRMNLHGRIPVCGMISTYNGGGEGVRTLSAMIYKRVRMEGFVSSDFGALNAQFLADMTGWLKTGRLKYQETVLEGFDQTLNGLIGLFSGENSGKMLIRAAS